MQQENKLTPEARSVIVQLLCHRIRTTACNCEQLSKAKFAEPCARCRIMANAREQFRDEYFTACEIVAKRMGQTQ